MKWIFYALTVTGTLMFFLFAPDLRTDPAASSGVNHPLRAGEVIRLESRTLSFEKDIVPGSARIVGEIDRIKKWKAVVYVPSGGTSWATAVGIGPRVLMTAAHNLVDRKTSDGSAGWGRRLERKVKIGVQDYSALCDVHPDYGDDALADVALCELGGAGDRPFAGAAEKIDVGSGRLSENSTVYLSGYGCLSGGTRALRIKPVEVLSSRVPFVALVEGEEGLCFGDSGGPVFRSSGDHDRVVVGVGTIGMIGDDPTRSAVVDLSFQEVARWIRDWVTPARRLCGVSTTSPEDCRSSESVPP